jgi:flagellar basal body-associated protein FliL
MKKKQKSNKRIILISVLLGVVIIAFVASIILLPHPATSINSYKECADAGYPVQTSFPEVCSVPGGKSFINN